MLLAHEFVIFAFKVVCSRYEDRFTVLNFLKLMAYSTGWYHKPMALSSVQSTFITKDWITWLVYLRRYKVSLEILHYAYQYISLIKWVYKPLLNHHTTLLLGTSCIK